MNGQKKVEIIQNENIIENQKCQLLHSNERKKVENTTSDVKEKKGEKYEEEEGEEKQLRSSKKFLENSFIQMLCEKKLISR